MANSFKFASRLQFLRDSVLVWNPPYTETEVSTTSELALQNVQVVGTTHEVINANDVTDSAMAEITNLHASATVSVGGDSAGSFVLWFTIPAGETAHIPRMGTLASTYLKSTSASTSVRVTLIKIA